MDVKEPISQYRLFFLIVCFLVILLLLSLQFGKFMIFSKPELISPTVQTTRGAITDRSGKLLAVQTTLYNLAVNKTMVTEPEDYAKILSKPLQLSEEYILQKFLDSSSNFMYLKKKMSEGEKTVIAKLISEYKLKGLRLEANNNRTYPENKLASTVIGFLGDDGKGLTGVEYSLQKLLSPPETTEGYTGAGYNVSLTLDSNIQYIMQKHAQKTMQETQPEGLIFLAINAKTGEVLSYLSEPSPDLSNFTNSSKSELMDRPANYIYEPGSVFKIFSIAGFLELGSTTKDREYICDGAFEFDRPGISPITCLKVHGTVTPKSIIWNSCNTGISQIAENANSVEFEKILRKFGFGSKTGIELPGETKGIFAPVSRWSRRSKHTIAMGQEIGVSALQIVEAATAFANNGNQMKLTLISKITDKDGKVLYVHTPEIMSKPISKKTANLVLGYMKAEYGIGWRASIGDVPIAVKTGTAQMADRKKGGYSKTDYIASCIGLFPADNPQIILYMAVIKPKGEIYGSLIAAPVISEVASEIIDYYGMSRDGAINIEHTGIINVHSESKIVLKDVMPDLRGKPKKALTSLFLQNDYKIIIKGDGYVVSQKPAPNTVLKKGMVIELVLE